MHQTRVTGLSHLTFAALSLLMATAISGCKAESNTFSAANASVGSGTGSVDANTGFRFRLKPKTGVDSFVHLFGDVNSACEITPTQLSTPTSIRCMANMMEYDLWFYGYEYEVSIAADQCTYLEEAPYRYYKGEAGRGPSSVVITINNGTMTQCEIDGVAATGGLTCRNSEASFSRAGAVLSCAYDYSKGSTSQPNCCQGTANVTVTTITPSTATPPGPDVVETTTNLIDYGGKIANCLESPNDFISDWRKDRDTNLAVTQVTGLQGSAFSKSVKIPAPQTVRDSRSLSDSVFFNSGFHGWNEYAANPNTWASTVTVPRAMAPLADMGANGSHVGTGATALPSYSDGSMVFRCVNPAGEVKHRIAVYMNEWNTIEDYTAFKTTGDASAVNPNRTGIAGVDCSAINGTTSCNSFWGWDDIIYDTTFTAGGGLSGHGNPAAYVYPYEGSRSTPP